jgi:membrane-associated protease RseP (regulator of RpoE activity)
MSDAVAYLLGVLVVAVGVAVSIALHEVGHLVPAKRFGVKVTQYMVGFGPTVWSTRRGETEYGVKGIPLGGYIRMIGMFPPAPGGDPRMLRASSTGPFQQLAVDARHLSAGEIGPGEEDRVFYRLSVPKKLVVMLGGPVMNLVLGTVLIAVMLTGFGTPAPTTTVAEVNRCVVPAAEAATRTACEPGDAEAPAFAAGVLPGDVVLSLDGVATPSWDAVREQIRVNGGREVPLVVGRGGEEVELRLTPLLTERPVFGEDNRPLTGTDGAPVTETVGFLGVAPTAELARQPLSAVPGVVTDGVVRTGAVVLALPQRMVDVAEAAFGDAERDPEGPIGVVGVGRLAGEISTIDEFTAAERVATLIGLLAGLNLALFVFNLVPLMPLDGGHVAAALWEGGRRQVARVRGRPDPGPVDIARLLPVTYVAAAVLVAMSVLLLYADIVRPITLRG